jgi:hypothetical protein
MNPSKLTRKELIWLLMALAWFIAWLITVAPHTLPPLWHQFFG